MRFKFCKCCMKWHVPFDFKLSENSDDGRFPICKECVEDLYLTQVENYERYYA